MPRTDFLPILIRIYYFRTRSTMKFQCKHFFSRLVDSLQQWIFFSCISIHVISIAFPATKFDIMKTFYQRFRYFSILDTKNPFRIRSVSIGFYISKLTLYTQTFSILKCECERRTQETKILMLEYAFAHATINIQIHMVDKQNAHLHGKPIKENKINRWHLESHNQNRQLN